MAVRLKFCWDQECSERMLVGLSLQIGLLRAIMGEAKDITEELSDRLANREAEIRDCGAWLHALTLLKSAIGQPKAGVQAVVQARPLALSSL